jgi:HAD-hyrolase-like protein
MGEVVEVGRRTAGRQETVTGGRLICATVSTCRTSGLVSVTPVLGGLVWRGSGSVCRVHRLFVEMSRVASRRGRGWTPSVGVASWRPELLQAALTRADVAAEKAVFLGGTPADVAGGRDVGVRVIAVATGRTSAADLQHAGADMVLDGLSDTDRVLAAIWAQST